MWNAWGQQMGGGVGPSAAGGFSGAAGIPAAGQKRSFGAAFEGGGSQEIIKNLQRTDPVGKEQWIAYVDQYGEGKRDPNRHDETFIQNFLTAYNSGQRFQGGDEEASIANVTKLLQKRSSSFKTIWAQFCLANGGGKNDPAKHEAAFHVQFYDLLSQKAMFGMMGGTNMKMMGGGMGGTAAGMGGMGGMATAMGGMGGSRSGHPTLDQLVTRIKAYQRMGDMQKQSWWSHCDTMLGGVRDPARHDADTLQAFIDSHGVPEADASGGAGCMAGMMGMAMGAGMGAGMGAAMPSATIDDPQKQSMVDRVKAFQKGGESQKEAWYSFCGKVKDPARHDMSSLQEFITNYGVP